MEDEARDGFLWPGEDGYRGESGDGAYGNPLDWRGLDCQERCEWFERLWHDVIELAQRYRLPVQSRWWESGIQVEALAALASWVAHYDSGVWNDPPGKLALLYDIERIAGLLRDGYDPFDPDLDRPGFTRHLLAIGRRPPGRGRW